MGQYTDKYTNTFKNSQVDKYTHKTRKTMSKYIATSIRTTAEYATDILMDRCMRKKIQILLFCLSSGFRQQLFAGPPGASQRNGEAKQRPQPGEGTQSL